MLALCCLFARAPSTPLPPHTSLFSPVSDYDTIASHRQIATEATAVCSEVQATAAPALVIVAAMQPFNALAFVGDGVFQGAKDFQYLAAAMAVACAAAAATMSSGDGSVESVWAALAVLQVLRGAAVAVRYINIVPGFGDSPLSRKAADAVSEAEEYLLPPEEDT